MATLQEVTCDVLVVGGGINGAGVARDAAGRGLSVLLCEKDDLAAHTSSASTKLIHGGLRYLEQYEFGLVRKALIEREVLLRSAPHIIRPLRFVMPHDKGQRPALMIRAGLLLYDHLAPRQLLPASSALDLRAHPAGAPLKSRFKRGFAYSDGWADDARLVVLNAVDAFEKGAAVYTRTVCERVERRAERWQASLRRDNGDRIAVGARCLVNAAGPWAGQFLQAALPGPRPAGLRLIKGSHIVVKRLFEHEDAYIFQHPDGRIVFAIPYEQEFTLIGTTELDYRGDPDQVAIDQQEVAYLCELVSYYFAKAVTAADVVWTYSGVRPLTFDEVADPKAVTRNYHFELDQNGPPMLNIFGGKLTTYRKLAEEALDLIAPALRNRHGAWTAEACLPGGDLFGPAPANRSVLQFDDYLRTLRRQYAWLAPALAARYARAYGSRIHRLLGSCSGSAELGEEIVAGLFAAEVDYLRRYEWATRAEDILWRRSKLGLHLPAGSAARLDAWLAAHPLP